MGARDLTDRSRTYYQIKHITQLGFKLLNLHAHWLAGYSLLFDLPIEVTHIRAVVQGLCTNYATKRGDLEDLPDTTTLHLCSYSLTSFSLQQKRGLSSTSGGCVCVGVKKEHEVAWLTACWVLLHWTFRLRKKSYPDPRHVVKFLFPFCSWTPRNVPRDCVINIQ